MYVRINTIECLKILNIQPQVFIYLHLHLNLVSTYIYKQQAVNNQCWGTGARSRTFLEAAVKNNYRKPEPVNLFRGSQSWNRSQSLLTPREGAGARSQWEKVPELYCPDKNQNQSIKWVLKITVAWF